MNDKPSRRQIVESLRNGDRDPFGDADRIDDLENFDAEAIHLARNGSVALQFSLRSAYEGTTAGQVIEFDIMENENDT